MGMLWPAVWSPGWQSSLKDVERGPKTSGKEDVFSRKGWGREINVSI